MLPSSHTQYSIVMAILPIDLGHFNNPSTVHATAGSLLSVHVSVWLVDSLHGDDSADDHEQYANS
jgi:hypothetical protein